MENEVFETRGSKIWLGEDGILRVLRHSYGETTLDDAIEMTTIVSKIANDKQYPTIIDTRQSKGITREAREYAAGEEPLKFCTALAILIGSPLNRMVGNFFLRINKPSYPTKLFTSETKALKWLRGYLK